MSVSARGQSTVETIRKALLFPLIRIPLLGGVLFLGMGVSNGFMVKYATAPLSALVAVVLMVALALAVYCAFVRYVENRPVTELALSGAGRGFGLGLPILPMALSSAFLEELIHRGVLFRVIEEYVGSWIALIVTAGIFGARHLGNPDATLLGAVFVAVEGGVLLAAAYMLTRRLWMPIGLHLAWNFAEAGIFSGDVSGVRMPPGLLRSAVDGPELMTGGPFGVEASLVAFLLCAAAGLVVLALGRAGKSDHPSGVGAAWVT